MKRMYELMVLIRRFEERAGQMYGMGLIGGFCHLSIGQEAVYAGLAYAKKKGDGVFTSYRCHGPAIACGVDINKFMAELTGREAGLLNGRGGSTHIMDPANDFYGGHGIVGAQVPPAGGFAFAQKYKEEKNVTFCLLGDGASNNGQFSETMNMATLYELPIVFVIENNRYGMGTSVTRASARTDFYNRGVAFGIPGQQVDGMDATAAAQALQEARERALPGKPLLLEIQTYRYRGHSMADPAKYRSKEEVDKMRQEHDPITHLGRMLEEKGLDDIYFKSVEKNVRERVAAAAEFSQMAPEPEANEENLSKNVYDKPLTRPASVRAQTNRASRLAQG
ncbi:MAG TPA: pyruvate dehydrogenase (acetyl-transferring) E1 component subunit alpha [Alphaproteobacteria bacterium]|nr:pyruvate dehydrogenase (acetyl-transferring) E1 component subunit alpha [Alphaproteobacteria bacterium]